MKVFVVLEEDRGFGASVAGVFASLEAAEDYLRSLLGSNTRQDACVLLNYYINSYEGEEVQE
jgi:hypothetical protein